MIHTTIITPHQHRSRLAGILVSGAALLSAVAGVVYSSNQLINLQYRRDQQQQAVAAAKAVNVDLKNKYYQLVDAKNLLQAAADAGLVLVEKPEYLSLPMAATTPLAGPGPTADNTE